MNRCGYVAIVGRPNVGKSTLLNQLLQKKYAVTSRRAQTTRYAMTFIYTDEALASQFLLVDTPGLLTQESSDRHFTNRMHKEACHAIATLDLRWWVLEAGTLLSADQELAKLMQPYADKTIVVLNKIDQAPKAKILPQILALQAMGFHYQVPCSALERNSLNPLLKDSYRFLPEQDFFYPASQHVTYTQDFLIREVVREKIMRYVGQEVPYYCHVACELVEQKNQHLHLHVRIEVPNDRYKTILLGAKGQHMKKIGEAARHTLESILQTPIFLKLWIKVSDGPNALEKEQQQAAMFGWSS